jgi:hypothetical protein
MKLKNAPARKLARQARAQGKELTEQAYQQARAVRTKKNRSATRFYR